MERALAHTSDAPTPAHRSNPMIRISLVARLFLAFSLLTTSGCDGGSGAAASRSNATDEGPRGLVIVNSESEDRPYFHDFGTVSWGEVVEHTYELVNTDPDPVTIRDLTPSCGCALPVVWRIDDEGNRIEGKARDRGNVLVVPPGRGCFVKMRVNTREVKTPNRDKLAQIRLRSNSKNNAFLSFEGHVIVRLLFQATPLALDLGRVGRGVGGTGFTEIVVAVPESTARLIDVKSHDPLLEVDLTESVRFGNTLWTLTARFPAEQPLGPHLSTIVLRTTDIDGEGEYGEFKVPFSAQVVEDVTASPPILALGSFDRSTGAAIETTLRTLVPGHRLSVLDYEVVGEGSEDVQIELRPVSPDAEQRSEQWIIAMTVPPDTTHEAFSGRVTLRLDDEVYPSVELPYSGRTN